MSYAGSERSAVNSMIGSAPQQPTLNARLNTVLDRLLTHNRYLNRIIDNVEGRPSQDQGEIAKALPSGNRPLASVVEMLEAEVERLHEIVRHIEQVA